MVWIMEYVYDSDFSHNIDLRSDQGPWQSVQSYNEKLSGWYEIFIGILKIYDGLQWTCVLCTSRHELEQCNFLMWLKPSFLNI